MRGKISYYNESTQTGVVVDKAKVPYEFKRSIWYDQHRLPNVDMYVDFRANGQGKIEQIKESVFVKLQRKYDVGENDFWQSADEEALEDLAVSRREKLINDGIIHISPSSIQEIYSMSDCFLAFFADAVELIYRYEDMAFDEAKESEKLDYFKLKRFMHKAKSQLIQTDGSISVEPFNAIERELAELEFVLVEILKQKNKSAEVLFEEIYLSQQIDYLRYERRLKLDTQKVFELNLLIKRAHESIFAWKSRLDRERNEEIIKSLELKISRMRDELVEAEKEIKKIDQNKPHFEECIKRFKEYKYNEFVEHFGFETELKGIIDTMRQIIDRIAFDYDTLIWRKALSSNIVRNMFFKHAAEGNFCTTTFLRYYLKPLNKSTLSKPDEALYGYLAKYEKYIAKHVLVLSEQKEPMDESVIAVYSHYKDSVVHRFGRAVDSVQWLSRNNAILAILDEQNRSLTAEELAESYAASHPLDKFGILVFNSQKASRAQASQNIEIVKLVGYNKYEVERQMMQMIDVFDGA